MNFTRYIRDLRIDIGMGYPKSFKMSAPLTHTLFIMIYFGKININNVLDCRNKRMQQCPISYRTDAYNILAYEKNS